jgi:dGTPase
VLYSDAFRRLGFVTQVISPYEHIAVHTRLTHVLKVAQIGRRLAERLLEGKPSQASKRGGLSADVVEAAALAHDLGHPPFGHVVEEKLNELAVSALGNSKNREDGFEGNAQSFRLVTKLETRGSKAAAGLDLTRATLNALLKYPWLNGKNPQKIAKWGAYKSEQADFHFAREQLATDEAWALEQTLEAQIMDWADDVTYAVHDLEDFYRARKIPLHVLRDTTGSKEEIERVLEHMFSRLRIDPSERDEYKSTAFGLFALLPVLEAYSGSRKQRQALADFVNSKLADFVLKTDVSEDGSLKRESRLDREVTILKQLTWFYVIEDPGLAEQHHGQCEIVKDLFEIYSHEVRSKKPKVFPPAFREQISSLQTKRDRVRFVIDLIAGMGEQELYKRHQVLTGSMVWNRG